MNRTLRSTPMELESPTSATAPPERVIVMLGMHPQSKGRGGISSVVDVYKDRGLFARWPIVYLGTACAGTSFAKIRIAAAALWQFLRIVSAGRLALLHAHTASRASFWRKSIFMLTALAARKPVVLHLHGGEFDLFYYDECGPLRRRYIRFVLEHVDVVLVLSRRWHDRLGKIAPHAKVAVISNPVAIVDPDNAARRRPDVLLFLGRLVARKGVFDLLEALAIVRTRFPSVTLRYGGEGEAATTAIITRARELGVESCVEMLGWIGGSAKQQALEEATIFVLPSYAEGLPMGVLEAMAAGAAVVATPVGGIPDVVDDEVDGFLVEPGDVQALAERIVRLLGDAGLREAFAGRARKKVLEQFSPERVLTQLENLYEKLGARPCRPPEILEQRKAVGYTQ
jgi:glycosyltransferase involved in cell wall biosynthesis